MRPAHPCPTDTITYFSRFANKSLLHGHTAYGFPPVFPLFSYGFPMVSAFPIVCLWVSQSFSFVFPLLFLICSYSFPMVSLCFSYGFPMVSLGFLKCSSSFPKVSTWFPMNSRRFSLSSPQAYLWVCFGFLSFSDDFPIIFLRLWKRETAHFLGCPMVSQ